MERILANEILTTIQESSFLVDKTLGELKETCPQESFRACAKLLGYVMSEMFDTVMAPIYDEHPYETDKSRNGEAGARRCY